MVTRRAQRSYCQIAARRLQFQVRAEERRKESELKIKAISFDCYGTLIDWESGIAEELSAWARRCDKQLDRAELLAAFGDAEPRVQSAHPEMAYPDVLAEVARRIGRRFDLPVTDADAASFGASIARWPPFPDTTSALSRLRQRYRLAVLSNIDRKSFAATREALGVEFDLVCTAEEIGSYKPDPRNFRFLLARLAELGIEQGELLHAAQSLFHDIEPARAQGIRTAWVDRYAGAAAGAARAPQGRIEADIRVSSLDELVESLR
ncbi:MAG: haloacid dehalogenase type II [Gammaproteobacteria bacterium]|nr:haloacid dehalogenase type II [Gammaproteobacteria bacterium]MYF57990.1 haloacid dehalogenase type II [Gammaproteobacteria bacterium]MYH33142.1 haloacid dehalogenase type II [Gammaproteobacteria bacterium]MYL02384.1 haloacid dehalogenase type II [Gammaproteobacteria bacterium]